MNYIKRITVFFKQGKLAPQTNNCNKYEKAFSQYSKIHNFTKISQRILLHQVPYLSTGFTRNYSPITHDNKPLAIQDLNLRTRPFIYNQLIPTLTKYIYNQSVGFKGINNCTRVIFNVECSDFSKVSPKAEFTHALDIVQNPAIYEFNLDEVQTCVSECSGRSDLSGTMISFATESQVLDSEFLIDNQSQLSTTSEQNNSNNNSIEIKNLSWSSGSIELAL